MNENKAYELLKSALTPDEPTARLDSAIKAHLSTVPPKPKVMGRTVWGLAAAAVISVAVWVVPTLTAEASFGAICQALDSVRQVRITSRTFDSTGHYTDHDYIDYSNGDWVQTRNGQRMTCIGGKTYRFDVFAKSYVVASERRPLFGLKRSFSLSSLVAQAQGKATIDHTTFEGRPAVRAILDNPMFRERTIVYADPKTDLPFEAWSERFENGVWETHQKLFMDYAPNYPAGTFALESDKYPVLTEEQVDEKFSALMAKQVVATVPAQSRPLASTQPLITIRAVDVAADGTVYVAYDAGPHPSNSWSGYALVLTDNLGTRYLRQETFGDPSPYPTPSMSSWPQVEEFVPETPADPWKPRTLTFMTAADKFGKLVRILDMTIGVTDKSGQIIRYMHQASYGPDTRKIKAAILTFAKPTCDVIPGYFAELRPMGLEDDIAAMIRRTGIRADSFEKKEDWNAAARWYTEELRAMDRASAEGTPYATDRAETGLAKAQAHLGP